jgi:hypothetical protein
MPTIDAAMREKRSHKQGKEKLDELFLHALEELW